MPIKDVARELLPPSDPITRWRFLLAFVVFVLCIHAAASNGLLGGYGAHAAAADVKQILELQLASAIRDQRRLICEAEARGDDSGALQGTMDRLQRQYRNITGERYPVAPCASSSSAPPP